MHYVSRQIAYAQGEYNKHAVNLINDLNDRHPCGGGGDAAGEFSKKYNQVGRYAFALWAASVESIGGVAIGLNRTANNYAAAEHATDPKKKGPAPKVAPPDVIEKAPKYPTLEHVEHGFNSDDGLDWHDFVDGHDELELLLAEILFEKFKGFERLVANLPLVDSGAMRDEAQRWQQAARDVQTMGSGFDGAVSYITDDKNGEWQQAMHTFCRSVWGTTAWGHERYSAARGGNMAWGHTGSQAASGDKPIMETQKNAANGMATACTQWAQAGDDVRGALKHIFWEALKKTVKSLGKEILVDLALEGGNIRALVATVAAEAVVTFLASVDQEALNKAMGDYEGKATAAAKGLMKYEEDLVIGARRAPKFQAEEARAEGFGARSLSDFKAPFYTVPGDDPGKHKYPVDLANQEGYEVDDKGGTTHTLDKHVGQTDVQLVERMRDERRENASSYQSLAKAQEYTQKVLDAPENQAKIAQWLNSDKRKDNDWSPAFSLNFGNEVTGRSVNSRVLPPQVTETHVAKVTLVYRSDLHPPYVVGTSYPSN
ncbi:RNase A-like domain-containing protein [Streptomyces odontomachi]|uniref:RNase A-like domain-containing protein n=1 Tax=Streptomyces odontomachi TaxID=2944940 RepID=UPI00210907C2|nr:RNase A-like domain-containing protein [Streptomyces sp. ODS25]